MDKRAHPQELRAGRGYVWQTARESVRNGASKVFKALTELMSPICSGRDWIAVNQYAVVLSLKRHCASLCGFTALRKLQEHTELV